MDDAAHHQHGSRTTDHSDLTIAVMRAKLLDPWFTPPLAPTVPEMERHQIHWLNEATGLQIETTVLLVPADQWPGMEESASPLWATARVLDGWVLAIRKPLRG